MLPISTIYLLDFGTVPKVWYFWFLVLFHYFKLYI